jgi:Sugar-binding N-terminal domain
VCPTFPGNGQTVYGGYLFVNSRLLTESEMRNHPLNPMTDSDLCRMLGRQSGRRVGLLGYGTVRAGPNAIGAEWRSLRADVCQLIVADTVEGAHPAAAGWRASRRATAVGRIGARRRARRRVPRHVSLRAAATPRRCAARANSMVRSSPVAHWPPSGRSTTRSAVYSSYGIDWTASRDVAVTAAVDWGLREIGAQPRRQPLQSGPAGRHGLVPEPPCKLGKRSRM